MITPEMTFGQRLKEFREDRELTQAELAKLTHVSSTTIANYEQDRAEPKLAIAVALADALEMDIEYLIPEYWHLIKEG